MKKFDSIFFGIGLSKKLSADYADYADLLWISWVSGFLKKNLRSN